LHMKQHVVQSCEHGQSIKPSGRDSIPREHRTQSQKSSVVSEPASMNSPRSAAVFVRLPERNYPRGSCVERIRSIRIGHPLFSDASQVLLKNSRFPGADCSRRLIGFSWGCRADVLRLLRRHMGTIVGRLKGDVGRLTRTS